MPSKAVEVAVSDLHRSLADPRLDSMNFLSEFADRYKSAISFASGRPTEAFFSDDLIEHSLSLFKKYLATDLGYSDREIRRTLFQYGPTKGIINELVARNLAADEGILVGPESIVVTVGCQEAMFLTLRALRATDNDVLMAVAPTYVGATGAARLLDMPVLSVRTDSTGVDVDHLIATVRQARAAGLRPRACYVMPDFANPTGLQMEVSVRRRLLDIAAQEDFLLLEDNPYGLYHRDSGRLPTLKSMDRLGRVIYFGSFAKTVMPGVRIGFLVADQRLRGGEARDARVLADEISKIKSMVTVNTPAVAQAVVGGVLLESDCRLTTVNSRQRRQYVANLELIQTGLSERFPPGEDSSRGVSWNVPAGGFFSVVTVPFVADDHALAISADEFGVLWTPMHHFYENGGGLHQVRLSSSLLSPDEIADGLDRFAAFVASRPTAAEADRGRR